MDWQSHPLHHIIWNGWHHKLNQHRPTSKGEVFSLPPRQFAHDLFHYKFVRIPRSPSMSYWEAKVLPNVMSLPDAQFITNFLLQAFINIWRKIYTGLFRANFLPRFCTKFFKHFQYYFTSSGVNQTNGTLTPFIVGAIFASRPSVALVIFFGNQTSGTLTPLAHAL